MAQGTVKPRKASVPTATRGKAAQGPKKGARVVAPKKSVLVRNAKITKVCLCLPTFSPSRTIVVLGSTVCVLGGMQGKEESFLEEWERS